MRYLFLIALLTGYLNSFSQLSVVTTGINPSCYGLCDGVVTTVVSGGVPPYSIQSPLTTTGVCPGTYVVTVTDSLGATATDSVTITSPTALIPTISISNNSSCFGNCDGSATITATGGTGSYSYAWNSAPVQISQTATGMCAGNYSVTVTDSNGCIANDSISILEPPLMSVTITTTDDTCGMCTGSANAVVSGSTAPYAYSWVPIVGFSGSTFSWLCAGAYSVLVTDANGCTGQSSGTVNLAPGSSCGWGMLNGRVYKDDNTNCNQDTLEVGLANVMIQALPGPYFASTDVNGDYSLVVPFGSYTVTQVAQPYYNEICPAVGYYNVVLDTVVHTINNVDFGDTITSVQEISLMLTSGTPRPGFSFSYYLSYTSINSSPTTGTVFLVVDDTITFQYASVTPDVISGDTLFWNYSNLLQFETRNISATFILPPQVGLLGDSLQACAQISPLVGDVNPTNNTSCVSDVIVGSYDPNDKRVEPAGVGVVGGILLSETKLTYKVRFQNSGTFLATNVVVVDTLSANLDITSLRNVTASHPFIYSVDGQGVLTFTFNNIMLPDSNSDEPGSHGLIQFTIDQNASNTIGTVIENTAEIYFDFNPAIVTNTVTNTIVTVTSVNEMEYSLNDVNVYPNPSNGKFAITFELEEANYVSIKIVDMVGKVIKTVSAQNMTKGEHKTEMKISNMNAGIYFMSIQIGEESHIKKIVVQ